MKNRLEIIKEIYGDKEWTASELTLLVGCIQLAQDEASAALQAEVERMEAEFKEACAVALHMKAEIAALLEKAAQVCEREWINVSEERIYGKECAAAIRALGVKK